MNINGRRQYYAVDFPNYEEKLLTLNLKNKTLEKQLGTMANLHCIQLLFLQRIHLVQNTI